jgi:hypothetical protein
VESHDAFDVAKRFVGPDNLHGAIEPH